MPVSLRVEGADRLAGSMGRAALATLPETAHQAMQAAMLLIEADARRIVPQDTRRLMGSISYSITGRATRGSTLKGMVGPSAAYGYYVEYGRTPGRRPPPTRALRSWAHRHGIPPGALFLIARKIGRRGIPARPFLQPAYHRNLPRIMRLFQQVGLTITASISGATGGSL